MLINLLVAELDVYLTHELEKELHVIQYPLNPPWRPEDTGLLQEIRYKPSSQVHPRITAKHHSC